MNTPQLSVIIPCFNVEKYLRQCLDSILKQVRSDVEIICVNDGSQDSTLAIIREYAAEDERIKIIDKPNGGVSSARNLGLQQARGAYIAWVDPDDYVSADWYARISGAIEQEAPDLIVMDSIRFGNGPDRPEIYGRPGGFVDRDVFMADVIRDVRMLSGMPNKVIRAELFQGVQFDTKLRILEDYAAIPQILKSVKTVYYLPHFLYHYRQHTVSLLHQVSVERAFEAIEIALHRTETVEQKFHSAAVTAVALQVLLFCRNKYVCKGFAPAKEQMRFCRKYVRRHLVELCRDPENPLHYKVKFVLLSVGAYGLFVKLRNRRQALQTRHKSLRRRELDV